MANVKDNGVEYALAEKKSILQGLRDSLPEGAHPTKRTGYILSIIFGLVVLIGALNFPFFSVFSGNTNIEINIGWPLIFLNFQLNNIDSSPIKVGNLIVDILLWVFLAYAIDILINIIMSTKFTKTEEEKKAIPHIYEDKKSKSIADRVTKKVFSK
ncbi:MAG: hypothetical protein NUV97_01515 [archaeon]|nr:hypothetical protein [archaeon]MCR4323632.1 hypothetical protein [Nanoarchaeota archaeon]